MICSDKYIKEHGPEIITEGFDKDNINPVSYDLTIESIISEENEIVSHVLRPEEMIFIKTKERISMPKHLMGRIGEKNSRLRQGLWVSGPHYFPGHSTYIFLRVKNISPHDIGIKNGDRIAQIFFEQLDEVPDTTYDSQADASFNEEDQYRGLGRYTTEYDIRIRKMQQLEQTENRIYANILTLMGLFVSVFSLIIVNFQSLNSGVSHHMLITIDLTLGFVIALFMGLIMLFVNRRVRPKWSIPAYFLCLISLLVVIVFLL